MRSLVLIIVLLVPVSAQAALTFTVNWTGTPNAADLEAAKMIVDQENARRATTIPPGTPLPFGTNAEKVASYKEAMARIVAQAHESYMAQAKEHSGATRRQKYEAAPQTVKDQIDTLLSAVVTERPKTPQPKQQARPTGRFIPRRQSR